MLLHRAPLAVVQLHGGVQQLSLRPASIRAACMCVCVCVALCTVRKCIILSGRSSSMPCCTAARWWTRYSRERGHMNTASALALHTVLQFELWPQRIAKDHIRVVPFTVFANKHTNTFRQHAPFI